MVLHNELEKLTTTSPNIGHWAKQTTWDLQEATALLAGMEPTKEPRLHELLCESASKTTKIYREIHDTLLRDYRSYRSGRPAPENPPYYYLQWAKEHGFEVSSELVQAVASYDHLRSQKSKKATANSAMSENVLNPKTENSYLITIYSLLVLYCGTDSLTAPTTMANEIIKDLAAKEMRTKIGDETLAKIIKKAREKMVADDFLADIEPK